MQVVEMGRRHAIIREKGGKEAGKVGWQRGLCGLEMCGLEMCVCVCGMG